MRNASFLVLCSLLAAGLAPPSADAATPADPASGGAVARPRTTGLTISANAATVLYGGSVTLRGSVAPAGVTALVVEHFAGSAWTTSGSITSAADGTWTLAVKPEAASRYRVRTADSSTTSTELAIAVAPRITVVRQRPGRTFVGAPFAARVQPAAYAGRITFAVRYAGRVRGTLTVKPRNGRIAGMLPAPGLGRMPVTATAQATSEFASARMRFTTTASARALGAGSHGGDVRALLRRLRELRFHTPGTTSRFDDRVGDVVLAFRKAQRMRRVKHVDRATWHMLAVASPMRPRHTTRGTHLEVDKTRQILMLVKRGKVQGTIHVSTGATGNTPEGRWRIYQRGGSHLYRFMAFVGNFGIHGYVPVPAHPASHGCVREPNWAAGWTWRHTKLGDRVYVYR